MKHLSILLALLLTTTAAFAQPRDIFDYTGQNNAPAGTKRLVFIAAKGAHANTQVEIQREM